MSALLQRRRRGHTVTGVMALDSALMAPPPLPLTVQSTKSCGLEAELEPEQIDELFKDALWRADARGNVSCFTLNNVSDTVRSRPGSSWLGRISVQKEVAVMAGRDPPAVYVYFRAHATGPTVTLAMSEDDPPWSVSLNDSATEFLVGSEQGTIHRYTISGELVNMWNERHTHLVSDLHWQGNVCASVCHGGLCRVWCVETGNVLATLNVLIPANAVRVSHAGEVVFVGANDGRLLAWDFKSDSTLPIEGHSSDIWCLAINKEGTMLASASLDRSVRLWDTALYRCVWVSNPQENDICSCSFDEKCLVIGVVNSGCVCLSLETGEIMRSFDKTEDATAAGLGFVTGLTPAPVARSMSVPEIHPIS